MLRSLRASRICTWRQGAGVQGLGFRVTITLSLLSPARARFVTETWFLGTIILRRAAAGRGGNHQSVPVQLNLGLFCT